MQIEARGLAFSALEAGPRSGRAVLLLHGFPQTSWCWRHQLEALASEGMSAVAFDQRGYCSGARPSSVEDYGMDELVADVLAVADELGWDRFDLVGHDWGAVVAWVAAARHPDRLRSLTALSVPHPGAFAAALLAGDDDQVQRSRYIEVFRAEGHVAERLLLGEDGSGDGLRAMFSASGLGPDHPEVETFVAALLEPGALTSALNWYRAMAPAAFVGVGRITVPTLYVWSDQDVALGRRAAEGTVDWVDAPYRFEVLTGVSHWIPETAHDALNALLLEHLRSAG